MLKNLKVAQKIAVGFGAVLLLMIALAITGGLSLAVVDDDFHEYRDLARETNEIGRIQANLLMTRMGVKDFLLSESEQAIATVQERQAATVKLIDEALPLVKNPKNKEILRGVQTDMAAYGKAFDTVVALQGRRNGHVDTLNALGPQLEQDLTQIMRNAYRDGDAEAAYHTGQALRKLLLGRLYVVKFLQRNDVADFERAKAELNGFVTQLDELIASLESLTRIAAVSEVKQKLVGYMENNQAAYDRIVERNAIISGTLDVIGPKIADDIEAFKLAVKDRQDELGPKAEAEIEQAKILNIVLSIGAIALGVILALVIGRAITRPLPEIMRVLNAAGAGDLSQTAKIDGKDEIAEMARCFNQMIESFRSGLMKVSEASAAIASASEEMAASSSELSRGAERMNSETISADEAVTHVTRAIQDLSSIAEQLAASAGTVASASEEMTASISEVARHAVRSSEVAHQANSGTSQANQALDTALTDMGTAREVILTLSDSAREIGEVIAVIQDIAAQTNLLALNATIEAARAGEAGKGFAVVANEVKNLANQTARATDDISNKIHATQSQVERTVSSIESVSGSLGKVHDEMNNISTVIGDIDQIASSIASEVDQQGAATGEISRNVEEVASAAKQVSRDASQTSQDAGVMRHSVDNTAGIATEISSQAAETAAAAGELSRLSTMLDGLVKKYKLAS